MKKASEYHQHARECHALATWATTEEQRQMLLTMAKTWENLAKEREARVAQKKRLDVLMGETDGDRPDNLH
jgi:hypothetical protein